MKRFESFLAPHMEAYLDYQANLGYDPRGLRYALRFFDRYLIKHKADWSALKPAFFLSLRADLQARPRALDNVLPRIKNLFQFLVRQGELDTNPLADVPWVTGRGFIPFVFSLAQVDELLRTVGRRVRRHPRYYLGDLAVYTALTLIARCGLRISEPIRLKNHHFVEEDGTVYIEKTKFRKDRLIPVPSSVIRALNNYRAVRRALIPKNESHHLLVDARQNPLSTSGIYRLFHPSVKAMGIVAPRRVMGDVIFGSPTVHCLRHAFAINTVKRIRDQGESVQYALPVLAAYMGHCKYQYTGAYLKVLSANQRQGLVDFARAHMGLK